MCTRMCAVELISILFLHRLKQKDVRNQAIIWYASASMDSNEQKRRTGNFISIKLQLFFRCKFYVVIEFHNYYFICDEKSKHCICRLKHAYYFTRILWPRDLAIANVELYIIISVDYTHTHILFKENWICSLVLFSRVLKLQFQ